MSATNDDQTSDVVWGAAAIAAVIRKKERQAFYLLEKGLLPARKLGGQWVASRKKLLAAVTGGE
jgi:hypothetical protein